MPALNARLHPPLGGDPPHHHCRGIAEASRGGGGRKSSSSSSRNQHRARTLALHILSSALANDFSFCIKAILFQISPPRLFRLGMMRRSTAQKHANIPDRIINLIYPQPRDSETPGGIRAAENIIKCAPLSAARVTSFVALVPPSREGFVSLHFPRLRCFWRLVGVHGHERRVWKHQSPRWEMLCLMGFGSVM